MEKLVARSVQRWKSLSPVQKVVFCIAVICATLWGGSKDGAQGGVTNHVPLLVGVKYAVVSSAPLTLLPPREGFVEIATNEVKSRADSCFYTLYWPLNFRVTEPDGHTLLTTPTPYDPGGAFSWATREAGEAVRLLSSNLTSSGCSSVAQDGLVAFSCSSECGCGGCSISGLYHLEDMAFRLPTVWCGCQNGNEDTPPEPTPTPHPDVVTAPSVSVSFTPSAVLFEDAYTNAPGDVVARQSTMTTLRISAYGGEQDASLSVESRGLERCLQRTNGHHFPEGRIRIPAHSDVVYEIVYEGVEASARENDISVEATLAVVNGVSPLPSTAAATAVRVEMSPFDLPPLNPTPNRHLLGIHEKVKILYQPRTIALKWEDESLSNEEVDLSSGESGFLEFFCPWSKGQYQISVEFNGAKRGMNFLVLEPIIECREAVWNENLRGSPGEAGTVGMNLALYLQPQTVSFEWIMMEEIPVSLSEAIPATGYFVLNHNLIPATHTIQAGAGVWFQPRLSDGSWTHDHAQMPYACPSLSSSQGVWSHGLVRWKIPIGFGDGQNNEVRGTIKPDPTTQEFEIQENGTFTVRKFGHSIERSTNNEIWLDGGRVR